MAESTKRHEENSNIIKEIRASTDAAIRNQGALIKTLEIQIGQMSKVLQERGFGSLPGSTDTNPRDQVKSILTAKANFLEIRRIRHEPYAARDVKILDAYYHSLPQKEKDPWSFTLPCFIHNICFDKALVDLEASVRVMPFSTYTNLGLEILSHTRLTIELADRTIKQPRGIAENVLGRIGKFIFPIDFIILDIPKDNDVGESVTLIGTKPVFGSVVPIGDEIVPKFPSTVPFFIPELVIAVVPCIAADTT
ncbi:ribonuclease H-like domain-containing protein [Tanacetum coccineum]